VAARGARRSRPRQRRGGGPACARQRRGALAAGVAPRRAARSRRGAAALFHCINSHAATNSQANRRKDGSGSSSEGHPARRAPVRQRVEGNRRALAGGIVPGATGAFKGVAARASNFKSAWRNPGLSTFAASGLAMNT
jgi:hypothetical protein